MTRGAGSDDEDQGKLTDICRSAEHIGKTFIEAGCCFDCEFGGAWYVLCYLFDRTRFWAQALDALASDKSNPGRGWVPYFSACSAMEHI